MTIPIRYLPLPVSLSSAFYAHISCCLPVVPHPHPELEQGLSRWESLRESFKDKHLGPMLWQFFAFTFAFSTFFSGFALFAERRFLHNGGPFGTKEVGYVFAFSGLIGVLIQGGGIGRLVKTFGESRLVQIGFATMAAGFVLLGGSARDTLSACRDRAADIRQRDLTPESHDVDYDSHAAPPARHGYRPDAVTDVHRADRGAGHRRRPDPNTVSQHLGRRGLVVLRDRLGVHGNPVGI
jgi:hypothetical protein